MNIAPTIGTQTFADLKELANERYDYIRVFIKKYMLMTNMTHQQFSDMHNIPRPSLTAFLNGHNNRISADKLDALMED